MSTDNKVFLDFNNQIIGDTTRKKVDYDPKKWFESGKCDSKSNECAALIDRFVDNYNSISFDRRFVKLIKNSNTAQKSTIYFKPSPNPKYTYARDWLLYKIIPPERSFEYKWFQEIDDAISNNQRFIGWLNILSQLTETIPEYRKELEDFLSDQKYNDEKRAIKMLGERIKEILEVYPYSQVLTPVDQEEQEEQPGDQEEQEQIQSTFVTIDPQDQNIQVEEEVYDRVQVRYAKHNQTTVDDEPATYVYSKYTSFARSILRDTINSDEIKRVVEYLMDLKLPLRHRYISAIVEDWKSIDPKIESIQIPYTTAKIKEIIDVHTRHLKHVEKMIANEDREWVNLYNFYNVRRGKSELLDLISACRIVDNISPHRIALYIQQRIYYNANIDAYISIGNMRYDQTQDAYVSLGSDDSVVPISVQTLYENMLFLDYENLTSSRPILSIRSSDYGFLDAEKGEHLIYTFANDIEDIYIYNPQLRTTRTTSSGKLRAKLVSPFYTRRRMQEPPSRTMSMDTPLQPVSIETPSRTMSMETPDTNFKRVYATALHRRLRQLNLDFNLGIDEKTLIIDEKPIPHPSNRYDNQETASVEYTNWLFGFNQKIVSELNRIPDSFETLANMAAAYGIPQNRIDAYKNLENGTFLLRQALKSIVSYIYNMGTNIFIKEPSTVLDNALAARAMVTGAHAHVLNDQLVNEISHLIRKIDAITCEGVLQTGKDNAEYLACLNPGQKSELRAHNDDLLCTRSGIDKLLHAILDVYNSGQWTGIRYKDFKYIEKFMSNENQRAREFLYDYLLLRRNMTMHKTFAYGGRLCLVTLALFMCTTTFHIDVGIEDKPIKNHPHVKQACKSALSMNMVSTSTSNSKFSRFKITYQPDDVKMLFVLLHLSFRNVRTLLAVCKQCDKRYKFNLYNHDALASNITFDRNLGSTMYNTPTGIYTGLKGTKSEVFKEYEKDNNFILNKLNEYRG